MVRREGGGGKEDEGRRRREGGGGKEEEGRRRRGGGDSPTPRPPSVPSLSATPRELSVPRIAESVPWAFRATGYPSRFRVIRVSLPDIRVGLFDIRVSVPDIRVDPQGTRVGIRAVHGPSGSIPKGGNHLLIQSLLTNSRELAQLVDALAFMPTKL